MRIAMRRLRSHAQHAIGEGGRRLAGASRGPRTVLLVLGCQRSGTTLITNLLATNRAVKVYPEHSAVSSRDPHGLRLNPLPAVAERLRRSRYPMVVLKPLVESQNACELLDGLPNARALWVFRHYADVARSNLARFGGRNGIKNLRSIARSEGDWRSERVSAAVERIVRERFDDKMNPWDAAALFWWARNQLFFEQALDARGDVQTCRYEELVADPRRVLRGIYEFAGGPCPRDPSVERVSSASVALGRAIPISSDVVALCEEMLSRLEKAHAENARCA
jgi:Sulfotransferase domain